MREQSHYSTLDIAINYDRDFDVLYIRCPTSDSTYGDEDENGVVTLRTVADDRIVGEIIYDFQKRCRDHSLPLAYLPIPLDGAIDVNGLTVS